MLRHRGAHATESIGARRSQRSSKCANDLREHGMRADSNRDRVQTRSHNVWNNLTPRQNDGEGPWPKTIGKFLDQLSAFAPDFSRAVEPLAIWQMNNERIEAGPVFRFKNFRDRDRIERISRETVNCFRRKRDKFALFQQFNCACDGGFGPR